MTNVGGRYEEVYGESPYLVAELGIAMGKGLQTDMQVASTAKHFIAYSNNKGAREGFARVDPQMSWREVENIHAYPFTRVIQEAGILGVMSSYNDYDGFPIQSSYYWLTQRSNGAAMGFDGVMWYPTVTRWNISTASTKRQRTERGSPPECRSRT